MNRTAYDSALSTIYLHAVFSKAAAPSRASDTHAKQGGVGSGPAGAGREPGPFRCISRRTWGLDTGPVGQSSWRAPPGWRKTRLLVFARYGRACWRCGRYAGTVDHVVPVALGGGHGMENLRPACAHHNYSAGASLGNRLRPRVPPWRSGASGARLSGTLRTSRRW